MTEQLTIEQMNELIARFMGIVPVPAGTKALGDIKPPEESIAFLRYDKDWNRLMPVWYKFVDLRFPDPMQQFKHSELKTTIGYAILYGSIKIAHGNIFEGIQWLNKQS
jgi:hypothetical protein